MRRAFLQGLLLAGLVAAVGADDVDTVALTRELQQARTSASASASALAAANQRAAEAVSNAELARNAETLARAAETAALEKAAAAKRAEAAALEAAAAAQAASAASLSKAEVLQLLLDQSTAAAETGRGLLDSVAVSEGLVSELAAVLAHARSVSALPAPHDVAAALLHTVATSVATLEPNVHAVFAVLRSALMKLGSAAQHGAAQATGDARAALITLGPRLVDLQTGTAAWLTSHVGRPMSTETSSLIIMLGTAFLAGLLITLLSRGIRPRRRRLPSRIVTGAASVRVPLAPERPTAAPAPARRRSTRTAK